MSDSSTPTVLGKPVWISSIAGDGSPRLRVVSFAMKRALDIVFALIGIVLLSPLMLTVALLIKYKSGSAIIYAHRRVGRRGLPFYCYKFKSMASLPDDLFAAYLDSHPDAAEEWKTSRKLKNDPRITPFGKVLRETSLDELPQLFNVLRGDMSFVGPRPIVYAELEHYGSVTLDYLSLRPGLTGLWQVSGRSTLTYPERVNCDRHYLRHWTILFDLYILGKTIPAVMRRAQAS